MLSTNLRSALCTGQVFKHYLHLEIRLECSSLGHCVSPFLDLFYINLAGCPILGVRYSQTSWRLTVELSRNAAAAV